MTFRSCVIPLLLLFGFLVSDGPGGRPRPQSDICAVSLTQILRIPVSTLPKVVSPESLNQAPATLWISPGATDELPGGPSGFDILDDGTLLIADPLRRQVSSFDPQGRFLTAWKIGFSADSVTVLPNGVILVREATTGLQHAFDRSGQSLHSGKEAVPEQVEARVLSNKGGVVNLPVLKGQNAGPLAVQFDKPGLNLLSIETLAIEPNGDVYVALESTAKDKEVEGIDVNKYVRRYAPDGKLLGEIADIPLDYYIPPVDELRVRKGKVYQLQSTPSEIRIYVWDTNQLCSHPSH